jgi:hypothetical protein
MSAFVHRLRSAGMFLAFVSTTASAGVSAGAADGPGDYSHTVSLGVSSKQAVVQLALPRAVYLEARSADLRDLRLFDAAGTSLPFALFEPEHPSQESKSMAPVAVFPVRAPASGASPLPEGLQIRTDANGTVISVTAPQTHSAGDALSSLVLDMKAASGIAQARETAPVSAIALTLPAGIDNYSARLALDGSDDLQHWETLADSAVSWLVNNQGARVRKDRIEFAPQSFRFVRIRWMEGTPVEFGAIAAERVVRKYTPSQRESVVLQAKLGTAGQDLLYDAPIAVPAESLGLELHGRNVVFPALVGQYRKQTGSGPGRVASVQLQAVVNTTFFHLTQDGRQRASSDIDIAPSHASQWVVRPATTTGERPGLRLRWTPQHMVFVAGGKGPYTLAFGRAGVQAQTSQVPLAQVAPGFSTRELALLEQAKTGDPVRRDSAGRDGSEGAADANAGKRSTWLWALLVCGVAALAVMAWKLTQQLKEGDRDQPAA